MAICVMEPQDTKVFLLTANSKSWLLWFLLTFPLSPPLKFLFAYPLPLPKVPSRLLPLPTPNVPSRTSPLPLPYPPKNHHLGLDFNYWFCICVAFFLSHTVASDKISEAEVLASKYKNTHPTLLDVTQSEDRLNKLIQQHDVVIR